jgi:ParB-like nuclease domain
VPLIITMDNYIVSGHRRYAACRRLGLPMVPCWVAPMTRHDPRLLEIIRECNRQRVKSLDEIIREQFLDTSVDPGIDAIIQERISAARVQIPPMEIDGEKVRAAISRNKSDFLNAVIHVLNEMREFWPLSDRQVYYLLLNDPPLIHAKKPGSPYCNDNRSYKSLCDLLTRGRIAKRISWEAIGDVTRPMVSWDAFPNIEPFLKKHFDEFLRNYYRDYQQSQPCYIEMFGEKNTIEGTIRPVAMKYRIPYLIGRGYCSLEPLHGLIQRFLRSGKEKLVLLVLSDFDPDGEEIAVSVARSIRDDFKIKDLHAVKVALTEGQVRELRLPPMAKAKRPA